MGEKPDRQKVDQHVSSESPTSFVRQLSDRVLSSNAVALVKELSYRAIPTLRSTPSTLQTALSEAPPYPGPNEADAARNTTKAAPHQPPASAAIHRAERLFVSVLRRVMMFGIFLGWVPLLITGVIYFVHGQSSSARATTISNATLVQSTTGGGSFPNPVAMIVGGSIWGFIMCMAFCLSSAGQFQLDDSPH